MSLVEARLSESSSVTDRDSMEECSFRGDLLGIWAMRRAAVIGFILFLLVGWKLFVLCGIDSFP
jgi:hypothetical protein